MVEAIADVPAPPLWTFLDHDTLLVRWVANDGATHLSTLLIEDDGPSARQIAAAPGLAIRSHVELSLILLTGPALDVDTLDEVLRDVSRSIAGRDAKLSTDGSLKLERALLADFAALTIGKVAQMAATVRPDFLDRAVAVEPETIAEQLARLRASIRESRAKQMLLARRDEIEESLKAQFRAKVSAIALKKPGATAMARPVEIDAFIRDLANNLAQGYADEMEILAEREAELAREALEPDEDDALVDETDSNETLGLRQGVQR